ncbi:MAG: M16 family metallopeptidase [Myxococcota bacterium]
MTQRWRIDNGLTVVFDEQHAAKVAAFQLWVKVGSADEREDQAGLAHLHEHMLFKGTQRRGPGEIAHDIEAHGGEINAWTSFDQTVYHVVIASQFARHGLDILADAVRHSAFDPEELAREIEVVCEEIKRSLDLPARRASKDLFATAFHTHPYRRPVIGWEESVKSFAREKVLEFYARHYGPQNLVLAAAGDFSEKELRAWVEESLGGDWNRPYAGPVTRPPEPALSGRRILLREDDVKEVYLNLGFPIPAVEHEDTPALDLLAMIAGQGEASRLVMEVKRKRALVNEVHTYAYTPKDPGLLGLSMTLPASTLASALEESARVLAELKAAPVTSGELSTVKALVESEAVYQRETVQGLARKLGYYEAAGGGIEQEARYYERIASLSAEQLQDVARRYLTFDRCVLTALLPPGAQLSSTQAEDILDRVESKTHAARAERRLPKPTTPAPMRVTAPLAARSGASGIVVERLPSGASIIVRPESAVPLFALRAVFPGGLRYEREEENGLTTLLARMLTRGTPRHDAEEISNLIDDLAGSLSGAGGRNSVSLRGEFLSRHFERAFELFADVLSHPTFPESELARERQLLLQDIHTREDKPSSVAFDLFARTLFQVHPYRLSTLGDTAAVERLDPDALARYHARFMDPSQLTLCVVGDVKVDRVLALAHEAFGQSRGKAAAAPTVPLEPPLSGPRQEKKTLARAQTHLVLGFAGARVTDPWRRALEVLSTVLSGQGGRLFVELRDKRSLAYSVSSLSMEGVDPGYFAVYMGTSPEKTAAALEGIRAELSRIREEKVTPAELERAKQHLIGTHEIGLQRNGARAALMALDHCYGLGADDFLAYADQVGKVTAEDVQEVARRVIDFERRAIATVGP